MSDYISEPRKFRGGPISGGRVGGGGVSPDYFFVWSQMGLQVVEGGTDGAISEGGGLVTRI